MCVAIPARRTAIAVPPQNKTRNLSVICLALFLPTENIGIGIARAALFLVQFVYNLIICSTVTSAAAGGEAAAAAEYTSIMQALLLMHSD